MRHTNKIGIIGVLICICIGLCGCTLQNNYQNTTLKEIKEEKVALNDRQKSILKLEGFDAEDGETSEAQQAIAVAIEDLLIYAEIKYNVPFSYLEYASLGMQEGDSVIAFPSNGSAVFEHVTIERYKEGNSYVYSDNYINVAVRAYYRDMLEAYIKSYLSVEEGVIVYPVITDTALTMVSEVSEESIIGKVESGNLIFIDASACTQEKFADFVTDFGAWMKENKFCSTNRILLLSEKQIMSELTDFNYKDYLETGYQTKIHCDVDKRGTVSIYY